MLALTLALLLAPDPPPAARTHTVVGRLVRLDVRKPSVLLAVEEGGRTRQVEFRLGPDARAVVAGRAVRVLDLPMGERAILVCHDVGETHQADVVKVPAPTPPSPPGPVPAQGR